MYIWNDCRYQIKRCTLESSGRDVMSCTEYKKKTIAEDINYNAGDEKSNVV